MIRNRKHIRLRNFDYSSEGLYYITICTKGRVFHFGNIENNKMIKTPVGLQANLYWNEIPKHFPQIELGEFVVMPNHIHGVIGIVDVVVGTRHGVSPKQNQFGKTIPGSISAIIGQYKASVSRWCNKNNFQEFAWQSRFYDHIIRNQGEFLRITRYIKDNIANWESDRFNKSL